MNKRHRGLPTYVLFATLIFASSIAVQGAFAEEDGGPKARNPIVVERVGATTVKGVWGGLSSAELSIRSGSTAADAKKVARSDLRSIRFVGRDVVAPATRHVLVTLVGGETIVGSSVSPGEDGVRLATKYLGTVDLNFEHMISMVFVPKGAGACFDPLRGCPAKSGSDVAYNLDRDSLRGTIESATAQGLVIENDREVSKTIPWSTLRVVHIENDLIKADRKMPSTEIELRDGTRLLVDGPVEWTGNNDWALISRSLPKTKLSAPRGAISALRMQHPSFVYLSDLPFTSTLKSYYEDPPELGLANELNQLRGARKDRRPSGCPLRVNGQTYRHGLAVHSHSLVRFTLGKKYAKLNVGIGIDDEVLDLPGDANERGDVDARITGDGKVLWEARGIHGGEALRNSGAVDLTGVNELVLEVTYGSDNHFVRDRANWVDPILIRATE